MRYILPLSKIRLADSATFGGKAASLGELLSHNLPVPAGFAISAQASKDFGSGTSPDFQKELLSNFDDLGLNLVAVRSSAPAEDSDDASWAGQLETYLNVERANLLARVEDCWASVQSDRAKSYAVHQEAEGSQLAVGVVVQAMVPSEVSGVMFTVDPVTKNRNTMIIESLYGLGELIVQGAVTPDHWQLSKWPLSITRAIIGQKDTKLVYSNGDNMELEVSPSEASKLSLSDTQVLEIASIGQRVESRYQKPQDIEWAYHNGHFFIVQSRPITTLS